MTCKSQVPTFMVPWRAIPRVRKQNEEGPLQGRYPPRRTRYGGTQGWVSRTPQSSDVIN